MFKICLEIKMLLPIDTRGFTRGDLLLNIEAGPVI